MAQPEFTREAAQQLNKGVIHKYYQGILQGKFPNPLRAMEDCAQEMAMILKKNKFPDTFSPLVATIGDVSSPGFNRKLDPEEREEIREQSLSSGEEIDFKLFIRDPFESEFSGVANDLGLYPGAKFFGKESKFVKILKRYRRIFEDAEKWGKTSLLRYETSGRGSIGSRNLFAEQAKSLGIEVESDDVWLTEGGMGALNRLGISINSFFKNPTDPKMAPRKARLLAPLPCFTMVPKAQKELGLDVSYISAQDLPDQELDGQRIDRYFEEQAELANVYGGKMDYVPDIMYLIPADNPTSRSVDPEKLRSVILRAREVNPEMVFFFDMAYMKLIPKKKAEAIITVIKETGAIDHAAFAFSDSKRLGQPGSRFGAIVIPKNSSVYEKQLGTGNGRIQETTRTINPGWSVQTDVMYQAVNKFVGEKDVEGYKNLLRQRQTALLEVLKELDPTGKYFKNLDRIHIPLDEDSKAPEGAVSQDVPLYLWVEVNKEDGDFLKKCFDIISDLNIVGVPGTVFGDNGHMRFSVGVISTLDILKKSDKVMRRWIDRLS